MRPDASGNLTYHGLYGYTYDAWNRLVKVQTAYRDTNGAVQETATVATMEFDGLTRRIVKAVTNQGDWE
jgi:hypothetical protein